MSFGKHRYPVLSPSILLFLFFVLLFFILIFNGGVHPVSRFLLLLGPGMIMLGVAMGRGLVNLRLLQHNRNLLALWGAILVWVLLNLRVSWSSGTSALAFLHLYAYGVFFLLTLLFLTKPRDMRRFALMLVFAAFFLLAQRVVSLVFKLNLPAAPYEFVSATHGHSHVVDLLVLIVPFSFAQGLVGRGRVWKWVFAAFLVGMVTSFSRVGLVVTVLSLVLTAALLGKLRRQRLRAFLGILSLLVVLFIGFSFLFGSHPTLLQDAPFIRRQVFKPLSGVRRLDYWTQAIGAIRMHPVTGTGAGTFRLISARFTDSLGRYGYSWFAHNWYLQTAAELGVVGLGIWLVFLVTGFKRAWWTVLLYRRNPLVVGLFAGVSASALQSFFDFNWEFPGVLLIFLIMLAMLQPVTKGSRIQERASTVAVVAFASLSLLLILAGAATAIAEVSWNVGERYERSGDLASARSWYLRSLSFMPLYEDRLVGYVSRFGPCCEPLFKADSLYRDSPSPSWAYGSWYAQRGSWKDASAWYEQALRLTPFRSPQLVLDLADAYEGLGEEAQRNALLSRYTILYSETVSELEDDIASQTLEDLVELFHAHIRSALSREDEEAAFRSLSTLVRFPNYGPDLYATGLFSNHAGALLGRGERKAAYHFLSRYLEIVIPDSQEELYRLDTAHREIARLAFSLSRYPMIDDEEKGRWLREALRVDPWQVEYYLAYGDYLEWYDRTGEERVLYQQCLNRHPGNYYCEFRLNRL